MKRTAIVLSAIFGALGVLLIALFLYYFGITYNVRLDPEKLTEDTTRVRLYDGNENEVILPALKKSASISELPAYLPGAFVAVEDKRFYTHNGFDYRRIGKALLKNIASFSFREGASTISQQLIKNTHLTGEKTISRKLREMKLTRALEKRYSKQEILSLYLNSIYFGHSAFGVENASFYYFGKTADALSPAESAMLAALVKSPNSYSPFRNPEKCLKRRNFVLSLMREQGYLSDEEYKSALTEPLPKSPSETNSCGASYLSRVFEELSELFPDKKSLGNLKVYTYYDADLQKKLEEIDVETDLSATVIDNKTHGIKALHSTAGPIKRLPASTIKPLLVYAPAFEENLISPATPVLDEKTDFGGYSPSDFGGKCQGYMSVRYALAHSVNIPAVKILNVIGVDRACAYLEKMNLSVPQDDRSLALALGGMKEGFTLSSLADGYSTFANLGAFSPSYAVKYVETSKGKRLYEHRPTVRRVFSEDTAYLINDILQTTAKEGTAKKLRSLPFSVAAKTGTAANANGNTDAYTISYTRENTVAVWMGMRDNSPIQTMGGNLPASAALSLNRYLYRNRTPEEFPTCDGVEKASFDKEEYDVNHRILLADPASPPATTLTELFRKSAIPKEISTRFTSPAIAKPKISVKNNAVCIELCQTEYYDYIIKRKNNGKTVIIYEGKYQSAIYDNSVSVGETYEYSVIPVYKDRAGEAVILPSVSIRGSKETPPTDDWWLD